MIFSVTLPFSMASEIAVDLVLVSSKVAISSSFSKREPVADARP
jgi:hypothetical protein